MSELKEHLFVPYSKLQEGDELTDAITIAKSYYIKSEADKVIEFWKNESHEHYERWFNLNKQYEGWFSKVCRCERAERELRHQKYKRCLAMAKWCFTKSNYHFVLARHGEDVKENNRRSILYSKLRNRWLELAEKFKSNNEVNNG